MVVITGAARGLGASLARELAARGAQTVLADVDEQSLSDLGIELDMPTVHCNVTDREEVKRLGRAAIDEYGKIDIWLNNAGVWLPYTPVESLDFNKARQLMEVNYFGLAHGIVEALRHMRARKRGIIANVLSVRALKGKALGAAYSASKFAAEGFTQAVREELAGSGVAVVNYYPYRIKTTLFGEDKHEDYEQSMEPADVARAIVDNLAHEKPAEHVEIWSMEDIRRS
jgi:NAD(P)-dependent dehydrogenase (short-subunit alcohol dehydrogenase family)